MTIDITHSDDDDLVSRKKLQKVPAQVPAQVPGCVTGEEL